jgi:UDP-N-acetylglucosamine diphosphorylase/glucosamine-1-phosphate N-acetyltransferase
LTVGLLALFEDELAGTFEPLALTRSVASLRHGAWTHRERWERLFPDREPLLLCRGAVEAAELARGGWHAVGDLRSADVLFVAAAAGRTSAAVVRQIRALEPGQAMLAGDRLLAARATGESGARLGAILQAAAGPEFLGSGRTDAEAILREASFRARSVDAVLPRSLVDLVASNAAAIEEDVASYASALREPDPESHPGAHLVKPERIRFGDRVVIAPGAVLDASDGPILIGPRTRVMAGAVVTGPAAIGADCLLKPLARVGASSLGPQCRVGGEVYGSIVIGWSNKQHDGFLGHSYVGAWVNLGAATDTSDLKNDYGSVRVTIAGATLDTGARHVGSLLGDHTKTAIHTRLNTGTVVGVACNVLAAGFPPKAIPSFCWGGDGGWSEYRIDKAIDVAHTVVLRRDAALPPPDEALLRALHAATAAARAEFLRIA